MSRIVCIVAASLMCVQAGAQVTPPSGTGSPASASTPVAVSPKNFPKSEAILPTGKTENQWGPFEGQVVDAETGEGVAGAALIVFWQKAILNPVEEHMAFYDLRWAVSDRDGHFTVPRRDPPLLTVGLTGAFLSCVAPGYLPFQFAPTYDPSVSRARLHEGQVIVRMRRRPEMNRLEKLDTYAHFSSLPDDVFHKMSAALAERRRDMGLSPFNLITGELAQSR